MPGLLLAILLLAPPQADQPASCAEVEGFSSLDFWLGAWDVYVGEKLVGHNRIEKILDGCAVMEHWTAAGGGEGKSLFYYLPATDTWKQVWVTGRATAPGGVKEKTLVGVLEGGALRFQGEIALANGGSYLDRTTLTPLPGGEVRQLIEVSRDGGQSWKPVFDATYRRKP